MNPKILLILTGSISIYKIADLVSKLKKLNFELRVVMSQGATKFIQPILFEGLCEHKVFHSLWTEEEAMNHIALNRWADLVLVAPASANFIAKAANGITSDLASSLVSSHDFTKPFLFAPAMNSSMFAHPATQKNLEQLKSWGYEVLPSPSGLMACGEQGFGRLLEPDDLILFIQKALNKKHLFARKKILITAGGTSVPIDAVRKITNTSTGRTGGLIANEAFKLGHQVTLVTANLNLVSQSLQSHIICHTFFSPDDLENLLFNLLSKEKYDLIIHLAAISDFDLKEGNTEQKITSTQSLSLNLVPRAKTISKLRKWAPHSKLIGFKLTYKLDSQSALDKVNKLFQDSAADFIVHNALENINNNDHPFELYDANSNICFKSRKIEDLMHFLSNNEVQK